MPRYAVLTAIAFFGSLGLPGFSGFVGELFTLMGSFQSVWLPGWITAVSVLGIGLAAAYFLWTMQRMFFGRFWSRHETTTTDAQHVLTDLTARERLLLIPLGLLSLVLGLFPTIIFAVTSSTVGQWVLRFAIE
jgi:NADH-quinone oxidoreductase subunit M